MKKFMTIFLAAALVFAFAGQASAAALETSGEYRGRYWYLSDYNYSKGNAVEGNQDFFDQRLRLGMKWQVAEGVLVAARADVLENAWDFTVGKTESEIDFDHAYVQLALGPSARLDVGKMDVTWGLGTYAAADNRYRVRIGGKFGNVLGGFAIDNITESFDNKSDVTKPNDDRIGYSLGAVFPIGAHQFGVLGLWDSNGTSYAFDRDFYAIVPYFKGAFGGVKVNAEMAYGFGEDDVKTGQDIDTEALFGYVGVFMPVGGLSLGLEGAYARGNDPGTLDKNEGLVGMDYNGPFTSFILFNQFDLDGWNTTYSGGVDAGFNNALALKASGTWAFTKQFSLMAAGVWAQADEAVADDDMGVEVDVLAKYAMTENVTLQAGLGYLAAGDYFRGPGGQTVDDPMVATAHAIVKF